MTARNLNRSFLAVAVGLAMGNTSANPTGATVARGAALLSNPAANTLQIVNTPGTIINWQNFSINSGEITRFLQQDRASAVLNRVSGNQLSSIFGRLESNGRVFLINPNGIVFGAGAVVDVAGLIASTRDISDANFAAGNYLFQGVLSNAITVQSGASITTSNAGTGGQVWLIAKTIDLETGSQISAMQGQVVLAAGTQLQVGTSNLGNMTFNVTTDGSSSINSLGTITAQRGAVGMFADSIVHGGTINAQSDGGTRGQVVMNAAKGIQIKDNAIINTEALGTGQGGIINLTAGNRLEIQPLASVSADGGPTGGTGGSITLAANDIDLGPLAWLVQNIHATTRSAGFAEGTISINQTAAPTIAPLGAPITLSPVAPGVFVEPLLTGLADGGFAVAWTEAVVNSPNTDTFVFVQRYSSGGAPMGGPVRLDTGRSGFFSNVNVSAQSVTPLANGGFVVTWRRFDNPVALVDSARAFDSSGAPAGAAIEFINTPNGARATALSTGGFLLTWGQGDPVTGHVQRYDSHGAAVGTAIVGDILGVPAASPRGGFSVQFAGSFPTRYDADGTVTGGTGTSGKGMVGGTVIMEAAGLQASSVFLLDFSGALRGAVTSVNGPIEPLSRPAPLSNGGLVFEFVEAGTGRVIAQRVAPDGSAQGPSLVVAPTGIIREGFYAGVASGGFVHLKRALVSTVQRFGSTPAPFTPGTIASGELPTPTPAPFTAGTIASGELPTPVADNTPPPPPAPPPAFLTGGGATFGGTSGCNASVCSDEFRAAIGMMGVERAFQQRAQGNSDQDLLDRAAREAVQQLQAAAEARRRNTGADAVEAGVIIQDYGQMGRLAATVRESIERAVREGRPMEAVETAAEMRAAAQEFYRRERVIQELGAYRSDPGEMTIVNSMLNMSDEQQTLFMRSVVQQMRRGDL